MPVIRTLALLGTVLILSTEGARAAPIAATFADGANGTLNGVDFTLTGIHGAFASGGNYNTSDYSFAPLSNAARLDVRPNVSWTISFETAVTNLLVYLGDWRGIGGDPFTGDTVFYDFSSDFVIGSGSGFTKPSANRLAVPDSGFANGVLLFTGPVLSLGVTDNSGATSVFQELTFAVDPDLTPVPLPTGLWLGLAGLASLTAARRVRG